MIRTATQLKAKMRNLSGGDNNKALMLIRNYFMQRFLERIAQSEYDYLKVWDNTVDFDRIYSDGTKASERSE